MSEAFRNAIEFKKMGFDVIDKAKDFMDLCRNEAFYEKTNLKNENSTGEVVILLESLLSDLLRND